MNTTGQASTMAPGNDPEQMEASPRARRDLRLRLPFFFGWCIVGASFVSLAITYGGVYYSFSVFYVALLQEFGWGRAAAAGVYSLFLVSAGLAGLGAGLLADRFGPGRVSSIGACILAAGLLACSRATELWQFYIFFGLFSAVGVGLAGWVPCVTMLNRWFYARLGAVVGIASSGIAVGILVVVPLTQVLIIGHGWRVAYEALAGAALLGVAPIALLVLRGRPEDLGLQRDGRSLSTGAGAELRDSARTRRPRVVDPEWANRVWTVASATRTARFWLVFTMMALASLSVQMVFVHQVAFLVDGGYERLLAASIVGLIGFISAGAKIGWGWVSDRLGREPTYTLGSALLTLGIGILILTRLVTFPPMVYMYAVSFALGYAVSPPMGPAIAADIFAGRHFGSVYGALGVAAGLGGATGAWFGGYIFDLTGSYLVAFGFAAGFSMVGAAALWLAAPRKVRRVPGWRPAGVKAAGVESAGS